MFDSVSLEIDSRSLGGRMLVRGAHVIVGPGRQVLRRQVAYIIGFGDTFVVLLGVIIDYFFLLKSRCTLFIRITFNVTGLLEVVNISCRELRCEYQKRFLPGRVLFFPDLDNKFAQLSNSHNSS